MHVAAALGVSRTPLREALTRLSGESFVEARPKHGFYVRPLSQSESSQLYAIRAQLDPWALRLAGLPDRATIERLAALNKALAKTKTAEDAIDLDDEWHLLLVEHCPNQVLLGVIRQMMWRTRRYEYAYFGIAKNTATAVAEHAKLIELLRRGDLDGACAALVTNMTTAMEGA